VPGLLKDAEVAEAAGVELMSLGTHEKGLLVKLEQVKAMSLTTRLVVKP